MPALGGGGGTEHAPATEIDMVSFVDHRLCIAMEPQVWLHDAQGKIVVHRILDDSGQLLMEEVPEGGYFTVKGTDPERGASSSRYLSVDHALVQGHRLIQSEHFRTTEQCDYLLPASEPHPFSLSNPHEMQWVAGYSASRRVDMEQRQLNFAEGNVLFLADGGHSGALRTNWYSVVREGGSARH
ncbi:hypothetical protein [Ferrimonas pelagia]|uniref:hypothetical protein n=1 Tax=Ferrimonas pelagia TaxID=1177826 RepID=UPI0031EA5B16